MSNTNGRLALITGANKGIGFETARQLAAQGITVLLGARDLAKGEQAAATLRGEGLNVEAIQLDVTRPESIRNAADTLETKYGRLDILINNAGVMLDTAPPSQTSQEVLRKTYETNVFAVVELTQALLPLLRKSDAGRIVNLSSILGSLSEHAKPDSFLKDVNALAYNSSKTALNMVTLLFAKELAGTAIKVNAAHPGWVKTDMGGDNAPLDIPEGARTSVWLATLPQDGPTGGFFHQGERLAW